MRPVLLLMACELFVLVKMTEITIKLEGTDLASRTSAAHERHKLVEHITAGNKVVVDLSGVVSMSYGYADELFGVLAVGLGFDGFLKLVRFENHNKHVLHVIAEAANHRIKFNRLSGEENLEVPLDNVRTY